MLRTARRAAIQAVNFQPIKLIDEDVVNMPMVSTGQGPYADLMWR